MKMLFYALAAVAVSAIVSSPCCAQAQAPPVKMGLWQTTATTTMSGLQLPPQVVEQMKAMGRSLPGATPTTTVSESCLTPERWQKSFQARQQGQECHEKNLTTTARGMSMDIECTSGRGSSTGHTQVTFLTPENAHATSHMEISTARSMPPMVLNMTMDSVYEGADCKGIAPENPKVLPK